MGLIAICVPPSVKRVFRSFARGFFKLFIFLLIFESSLYILDTNPLSDL